MDMAVSVPMGMRMAVMVMMMAVMMVVRCHTFALARWRRAGERLIA